MSEITGRFFWNLLMCNQLQNSGNLIDRQCFAIVPANPAGICAGNRLCLSIKKANKLRDSKFLIIRYLLTLYPIRMGLSADARKYFLGHAARVETAKTCHIRQDAHFINCGKPIDGEFKVDQREICVISLAHKSDPEKWTRYYVGHHVARDLLKLAGQELATLFDPLKSDGGKGGEGSHARAGVQIKFSPLNKEMFNAMGIFLSLYGTVPKSGGIFDAVQTHLREFPDKDISSSIVRGFNTAITKGFKTSLGLMLVELRAREPGAREFSFPLMDQLLGPSSPPRPTTTASSPLQLRKLFSNRGQQKPH